MYLNNIPRSFLFCKGKRLGQADDTTPTTLEPNLDAERTGRLGQQSAHSNNSNNANLPCGSRTQSGKK